MSWTLTQPAAALLLLLAVPILVIYMLRGNPRRRPTGAAFLWRGLETPVTARRKWRRAPRGLALWLQLLALAAGALALAQPAFGHGGTRQLVYVLDASASMRATDVQPSRFEAARGTIREALDTVRPGDQVTIIRLGVQPEVIASGTDVRRLREALASVKPGAAAASLRDALALASSRLTAPVHEGSEIVVLTDGTIPDPIGIGPLSVPVRFVRVGEGGGNQAVSALRVRRVPGESPRFAAFARVTNFADSQVRVPVRLLADGIPVDTRLVELPARGRSELPFEVPPGTRAVSVHLGGQDHLALDDRAEILIPENRSRSALLVSGSPEAWQHALGAIPGVDVTVQSPSEYRDFGAELVVLDGFLPPSLPGGNLLIVNPPSDNQLVRVLGEARDAPITSYDARHPVLRSLDLGSLRLVRASRLAVPRWASSVAETPGGPLILDGEQLGRRVVVLGFDPLLSGLEKLVTFPILVANTLDYLGGSGTDPYVEPGRSLTLPVSPDAVEIVVEHPDGTRQVPQSSNGAVRLELLDQTGQYALRQRLADGQILTRSFHVNLLSEGESDTAPRDLANWPPSAPLQAAVGGTAPPIWLPFVLIALGLLSVEWLHFVRRG